MKIEYKNENYIKNQNCNDTVTPLLTCPNRMEMLAIDLHKKKAHLTTGITQHVRLDSLCLKT